MPAPSPLRPCDLRRRHAVKGDRCYDDPELAFVSGIVWMAVFDQVCGNGHTPARDFWYCDLFVLFCDVTGREPEMVRERVGVE